MSEALRFNSDKPMMSYFMRSFPKMTEAVARVKEMGAIKYNDGNWRLGNKPDDEYWNSMFRHLNYIFDGEDYDNDTGCLHIAHAVWNMCALLELNHSDLPARDEAIWAGRAVHWAEEKRKRERMLERKASEDVKTAGASLAARWVKGEKCKREAEEVVNAAFDTFAEANAHETAAGDAPEATEPPEFAICPMCGCTFAWRGCYGLECGECGEILAVPIVPENGITDPAEADADAMNQSYIESVLDMFGPKDDDFGPMFSAFVRKIATRDDEVRSQYATHCAEEKRKRESSNAADAAKAVEGRSAACAAHWAKEKEQKASDEFVQPGDNLNAYLRGERQRNDAADAATYAAFSADLLLGPRGGTDKCLAEKPQGSLERFAGTLENMATMSAEMVNVFGAECPMCDRVNVGSRNDSRGLECKCGEIYEVPIGPEATEIAEITEITPMWVAEPPSPKGFRFEIKGADLTPPVAKLMASYFGYPLEAPMKDNQKVECPMCDSTAVWQGDYGRECCACGEIFEVPIVAENAPNPKIPKFIIRDAKPSPVFTARMHRIFTTLGRD
jgi:hypothetical protein